MDSQQLQSHYRLFHVSERTLLTGHSHQAWPDVALQGQQYAFHLAATLVDDKWGEVFRIGREVASGYAKRFHDDSGDYCLGLNTHDLIIKWLSALPFNKKRKIITTDGEFHTLNRQLNALAENYFEVIKENVMPIETLSERLSRHVDDDTLCVMTSFVFYESGLVLRNASELAKTCERAGVPLLVDVYHAVNAISFSLKDEGLSNASLVGGGYKYCQLGEGNAFLRVPKHHTFRPVITGWYAGFKTLEQNEKKLCYPNGAAAFLGATFDPTPHCRAQKVWKFFDEMDLTPEILEKKNKNQQDYLIKCFEKEGVLEKIIWQHADQKRGAFLVFKTPRAQEVMLQLRERGVFVDTRGDLLRVGPAPYITDSQLESAAFHLAEILK